MSTEDPAPSAAAIQDAATRIAAAGDSRPRPARDPVNLPTIRNWLEALGGGQDPADPDTDPMAPPAMIRSGRCPAWAGSARTTTRWAR